MSPRRLTAWLKRRFGESEYIALVYVSQGETEEDVATWGLKQELRELTDEQIADIIVGCAQEDCEGREMTSRYSVRYLGADKKVLGSTVIKQSPQEAPPDPLDIGPAATNTAIAQLVRMNEVQLRLQVQSWGQVISGYNSLISAQQNELAILRKREARSAEVIETATMQLLKVDEGMAEENIALNKLGEFAERIFPVLIERLTTAPTETPPAVSAVDAPH